MFWTSQISITRCLQRRFTTTASMGIPVTRGPYLVSVADHERDQDTDHPTSIRLYYPCGLKGKDLIEDVTQQKVYWLPSWRYAQGYGHFLRVPTIISVPIFSVLIGNSAMPTAANLPLIDGNEVPGADRFPIMVFSHGLGGMRTTYSYICADIASHGWVVAAVEHRDGSASMALTNNGPLLYERQAAGTELYDFRNRQVNKRAAEVSHALDTLQHFNDGNELPCLLPFDSHGIKFSHQQTLKGRLDMTRAVVAGHSFGGATAIASATRDKRFKACVALDAWMFPLNRDFVKAYRKNVPLLLLNTETFKWAANENDLLALWKAVLSENPKQSVPMSTKGFITGTAHQNQSDFPLLVNWAMKAIRLAGPIDPLRALEVNDDIVLSFLAMHKLSEVPENGDAVIEALKANNPCSSMPEMVFEPAADAPPSTTAAS